MTTKKTDKKAAVEVVKAAVAAPVVEGTETAYDVVYDHGSKKYIMVTLKYSLDNPNATVVSKEAFTGNQAVAIQSINNVFMNKMIKTKAKKK